MFVDDDGSFEISTFGMIAPMMLDKPTLAEPTQLRPFGLLRADATPWMRTECQNRNKGGNAPARRRMTELEIDAMPVSPASATDIAAHAN